MGIFEEEQARIFGCSEIEGLEIEREREEEGRCRYIFEEERF